MSNVIGGIELQILAGVARLQEDMNKARSVVDSAAKQMQSSLNAVNQVFGALGVGLSGAAFVGWIKGAINAADEADKLSQKMGIATDQVAGLKLAFQQSGSGGADVMEKAMARLAVEITNGNETLKKLGVTAKEPKEALLQMSDAFVSTAGGTGKLAAVVDVFGQKLGSNMIPVLNMGSAAIKEFDELAKQLGLTISTETGQQADQFNDTIEGIGLAMQGIATQSVSKLLPALNDIAGAFLKSFTEGGRLQGGIEVLDSALRGLVTTGSVVMETLNTLVKVIAGIGATLAVLMSGNREGAAEALRAAAEDIKAGWVNTAATVKNVWNGAAADVSEKSAEMARKQREAAEAAEQLRKQMEAQGKAAKDAAAALKKLIEAENDRKSKADLARLKREDEAQQTADRAAEAMIQADKDLQSARDLARMRREDDAEAEADRAAQDRIDAEKKANKQILDDWQRTVDQMGQAFADALMQGGKSIGEYLRGLFRTIVLRPIIMPTMTSLSAAMVSGPASAMGSIGGVGGAAGGMGGLLNIGGAMGSIGGFGAAAGAGASAVLGGAAFGDVMAGAGAMLGQGTMAGISGGLGLGLGAIAPYALGALALYSLGKKLFGKKLDDSGITGTFSDTGFAGKSFENYSRIIGGDSTKQKNLSSELDAVFDAGALAARESVKAYAAALGLPVKAIEGITQKIKFSIKGQTAEETQAEIDRFVGKYAETLASTYAPALKQFQKAGETFADTLQRLAGLQEFSNTLADLGGVFARIANLGVDARESLIDMAGGMSALGAKAMQFVQDYYNREEIAGLKAREIKDALSAIGITQDVNSREDFRKLVESTDVSTDVGRQQLVALLDMASAFTSVADYIAETGQTLATVASYAPESTGSIGMFAPGGTQDVVLATNNVGFWVQRVYDAIMQLGADARAGTPITGTLIAPTVTTAPEVNGGYVINYDNYGGA
jgi:hypothetical protein